MRNGLIRTLAWVAGLLAVAAGAILLFDEADALFGKRSGVRDSHDRDSSTAAATGRSSTTTRSR